MEASTATLAPLWPLALYFLGVIIVVAGMMGLSYILGQRHKEPQTGEPFESGIAPTGSARIRWNVKYYLVAMFFVVFDLEAAFLLAWAVAARELGWPGYIEAVIFIGVLLVALIYLWRLGALDWGTNRRRLAGRLRRPTVVEPAGQVVGPVDRPNAPAPPVSEAIEEPAVRK